jgi:hypothetical protein
VSGRRVAFVGDAMTAVVKAIDKVHGLIGLPPVVVGGVAVMCRLPTPYRATNDLDVVDRMLGPTPHLEILRAADGATPVEPAAVLLPTPFGDVKIDVLEVRQIELDEPSDDPGDRLHASSHAWANDTATDVVIEVVRPNEDPVEVTAKVAEPGPLIAMKIQAVMNRSIEKQGTDLLDIVRLTLDPETRQATLSQIGSVEDGITRDIASHVDLWLVRKKHQALRWIRGTGDRSVVVDDLDLVAELLHAACER